jgi:hypothetical protein
MLRYFIKPRTVNLMKFLKVVQMGNAMSLLYPRKAKAGVFVDNKRLDGFIDRFTKTSCQALDCEKCRYCHQWADQHVRIDPEYYSTVKSILEDLLDEMYSGSFWTSYARGAKQMVQGALRQLGTPRKAA